MWSDSLTQGIRGNHFHNLTLGDNLMTRNELKTLSLIFMIFIAGCIETDIYLPAFPDMMDYFSASEEQIHQILTWNFFGICLSCPLYGPLSDAYGRKKPLLIALGLFLLGSFMTIWAEGFGAMLWGRLLQGLGSGGCFTLGTAIIFDAFKGDQAIRAVSRMNSVVPFIIAGAPMAGGILNHFYGFRSNFLAIALCVLLSLMISLFFFKETLPKELRKPLQTRKVLADFKSACTSLPFWQVILIVSLSNGGILAFLSVISVLFVVDFGISIQQLPLFQAANLGAWLAASLLFGRAMAQWGNKKVKKMGMSFLCIGGIGFVIAAFFAPQNPHVLTACMMVYTFGVNWTQGLYFPEGMEILPDIKGVTASVLTSMRLLITALLVGVAGHFYNGTIYPLAAVIFGIVAILLPTLLFYEKSCRTRIQPEPSMISELIL